MCGVLHHNDIIMLRMMNFTLSQQQFIQKHLLASFSVLQRNGRRGGKVFSAAIHLTSSHSIVITALADAINVALRSTMKCQARVPAGCRKSVSSLNKLLVESSTRLGMVILLNTNNLQSATEPL